MVTHEPRAVKEANKRFYNIAADFYETVDGRRKQIPSWLLRNIKKVAGNSATNTWLDIGSGSGWLACAAKSYAKTMVATDISHAILGKIPNKEITKVTCDVDFLPFGNNSVDVVSCFAVLHHIPEYTHLIKEVQRVLKPGGIFYSDHDIDDTFVRRFGLFLKMYRKFFDASAKYSTADPRLTPELYKKTEIHADGIQSDAIVTLLREAGFKHLDVAYHWKGLNKITDILFGCKNSYCKGNGPIFSVIAQK